MFLSDDSDSSLDSEDDEGSSEHENVQTTVVPQEQWVKVIEFCSFKSRSSESVARNTGVEKLCGNTDDGFSGKIDSSWILNNNNQQEHLIVSFETPVFINEIHVYESLNPGSIVKLEMLEVQRNKWWTMWQAKSTPRKSSAAHNIFKPLLRRYHIQSNTIRITFDLRNTDRIGIQAIKLIGTNIIDFNFNFKTLSQAMAKLYEHAIKNIDTDIQFSFNDKLVGAHRNILCCRSTYFRSLLLQDFIERSQSTAIKLTDIDYEAFLEILYFIYTSKYHQTISLETSINVMIYANKINLLTAKNAAMEHICRHLRFNHSSVFMVYTLAKKMSPTFDPLLDYIYDLCSEHIGDICKQIEFISLEKEFMIDIIYQSSARRDAREQEKIKQMTLLQQTVVNNEGE